MKNIVTNRKILIVEDDVGWANTLVAYFSERGNTVFVAQTLKETFRLVAANVFDAIVLDIILPDGEGLDVFEEFSNLPPVVIVTTLGTDSDVLEGFAVGAADYVVKPCSPQVLEARLALRLLPKQDALISRSGLTLNVAERTAKHNGVALSLTSSEFNILHFFITNPGKFFSAAEIYEKVWHAPSLKTTTIKYHISNLRQKLLAVTQNNLIVTEFGKGYAFASEDNK